MCKGEEPRIFMEEDDPNRILLLHLKQQMLQPPQDHPMELAKELIREFDSEIKRSPLPENVDIRELDDWLYNLRIDNIIIFTYI